MTNARVAVFESPKVSAVRELPIPETGDVDGILRVEACGVCGSDLELFEGAIPDIPLPLVPGHEAFGRIERLGSAAAERLGLKEGDRVVVSSDLRCGRCAGCRSGRPCVQLRPGSRRGYGIMSPDIAPGLWGGYATHLYLDPHATLFRLDEAVDVAAAAFHNPLANGIEWVRECGGLVEGDAVLIAGAGPRGIACALVARHFGASEVTLTGLERDRARLELAERLGVSQTIVVEGEEPTELRDKLSGRRPRVVVDTTPRSVAATAQLLAAIDDDATLVLAGIKGPGKAFPATSDEISMRRLTVRGPASKSHSSLRTAIDLLNDQALPVAQLPSVAYDLDHAAEAVLSLTDIAPERPVQVRIEP